MFSKFANIAIWLTIPLLLVTLFFGENINDADRWLRIPVIGLTFQTSDLAKLTLTIYLAKTLSKNQYEDNSFIDVFIVRQMLPIAIVCALIAKADLSTALMIFMTSVILLFIGRVKMSYLLRLAGVMIIFLTLFITAVMNYKSLGLDIWRIPTWHENC